VSDDVRLFPSERVRNTARIWLEFAPAPWLAAGVIAKANACDLKRVSHPRRSIRPLVVQ
jgi:hypothetical protein